MRKTLFVLIMSLIALGACDKTQKTSEAKDTVVVQEQAMTEETAQESPKGDTPPTPDIVLGNEALDADQWVDANNQFMLDALAKMPAEGNIVFSPYSFERALGMTAVGARGQTRAQMLKALGFKNDAANLDAVGGEIQTNILEPRVDDLIIRIANRIYVDKSFKLLPEFEQTLTQDYGVSAQPVDFKNEAEPSRLLINEWVSTTTNKRIIDLLPPQSVDSLTRLVLVNALYFKAPWQYKFSPEATQKLPFRGTKSTTNVDTMSLKKNLAAFKGEDYTALILPYASRYDFGMLLLLPSQDNAATTLAQKLSPSTLRDILSRADTYNVKLALPKFKQESTVDAKALLQKLGMSLAFQRDADFSGIDKDSSLLIDNVFHKAFVEIDENGTEAAAATAVVMAQRSAMPQQYEELNFNVDHPFLFAIVHLSSKTILFLGRIEQL